MSDKNDTGRADPMAAQGSPDWTRAGGAAQQGGK